MRRTDDNDHHRGHPQVGSAVVRGLLEADQPVRAYVRDADRLDEAGRSTALRQFVRLSVLNASPSSLGINQRAYWNIAREWAIQAGENERLTDTGRHGIIRRTADRTEADH